MIIKVHKDKNYVQIRNDFLSDPKLSAKAKGILGYLLSKPEDWTVYLNDLIKHMRDGRDSIRSGLDELESNHYIFREQGRDSKGRFKQEFLVFEDPEEKEKWLLEYNKAGSDFPMRETHIGKSESENPPLQKKKEDSSKEESSIGNKETHDKNSPTKGAEDFDDRFNLIPRLKNIAQLEESHIKRVKAWLIKNPQLHEPFSNWFFGELQLNLNGPCVDGRGNKIKSIQGWSWAAVKKVIIGEVELSSKRAKKNTFRPISPLPQTDELVYPKVFKAVCSKLRDPANIEYINQNRIQQ